MLLFTLYSLFYLLFIFLELIPFYKDKKRKLFWVYCSLLSLSWILLLLISIGITIPSPAAFIKKIVTAVFNL